MTFRPMDRHAPYPAWWPTEQARRTNLNGGVWTSCGTGRIVKRQLSKARRRAAEELIIVELYGGRLHERGLATIEGEVNWRCT